MTELNALIALVPGRSHVDDGTDKEDEHRRQQNGQPYPRVPNEDKVMEALRPFAIPPGDYKTGALR